MPRLVNVQTGVAVSCSDETAARLGADWQPPKPPAPIATVKAAAPRRRSPKK